MRDLITLNDFSAFDTAFCATDDTEQYCLCLTRTAGLRQNYKLIGHSLILSITINFELDLDSEETKRKLEALFVLQAIPMISASISKEI